MAKFSAKAAPVHGTGPVRTVAPATTHQGGAGFTRDAKSDLFLLGLTNMVGEDTYYETASVRDQRFIDLVREVAVQDIEWLIRYTRWLRREGFMRSAPVVIAAEAVHARLAAGLHGGGRDLVRAALVRMDEPKELLAYWQSRFGRTLPKPIKRGLADALTAGLSEYTAMKYDSTGSPIRLGDLIDLVHPVAKAPWQSDLFQYLLDRRHHPSDVRVSLDRLPRIRGRRVLEEMPQNRRREWLREQIESSDSPLDDVGATWEWLSGWLPGGMDAEAWEAVLPVMGHMALIRNLCNFDDAGVSDVVARHIAARISDPGEVARGMQFPYRYLSAIEAADGSLRWGQALSTALDLSTANIPEFPGRTLVLVDTSGSMGGALSMKTRRSRAEAAAVFGAAVARRNPGRVDLVGFASGAFAHSPRRSDAALTIARSLIARIGEVGHGTDVNPALRNFFKGHDRILVFSDMQVGYLARWPEGVPVYAWNLGGYRTGAVDLSKRGNIELGGLSDASFKIVPLVESGRDATWPF